MAEIFESFELVAGRLSPAVLLVPGLVMVVVGLAAWLAGMCLRQVVLALFGAVVAGRSFWINANILKDLLGAPAGSRLCSGVIDGRLDMRLEGQ